MIRPFWLGRLTASTLLLVPLLTVALSLQARAHGDYSVGYNYRWFGTAPFCRGSCPSGWSPMRRDKSGDGKRCVSGWKVYCRRLATTLPPCHSHEVRRPPEIARACGFGWSARGTRRVGWNRIIVNCCPSP